MPQLGAPLSIDFEYTEANVWAKPSTSMFLFNMYSSTHNDACLTRIQHSIAGNKLFGRRLQARALFFNWATSCIPRNKSPMKLQHLLATSRRVRIQPLSGVSSDSRQIFPHEWLAAHYQHNFASLRPSMPWLGRNKTIVIFARSEFARTVAR